MESRKSLHWFGMFGAHGQHDRAGQPLPACMAYLLCPSGYPQLDFADVQHAASFMF